MSKKQTIKKALTVVTSLAVVIAISICSAVIIHDKRSKNAVTTSVENGLSAYELAVQYGYEGTVQEWLNSLNGKSAYEIAQDNGYSGSESDWANTLKATAGKDGVGIKTATFNADGQLVITLSDNTAINLGNAVGANGKDGVNGTNGTNGQDGKDGNDGVSITTANINADGQLVIAFSNGESVNLDKVVGVNGQDGISVTDASINTEGELVLTYSNGQKDNLGNVIGAKGDKGDKGDNGQDGDTPYINANGNWQIGDIDTGVKAAGTNGKDGINGTDGQDGAKGDKGDKGDDGVGISLITVTNGNLSITLTSGTTLELGNIKGSDGVDGRDGADGTNGQDGIGVKSTEINQSGELVITYSNNNSVNLGKVTGTNGTNGQDGNGITKTEINANGELVITYSNGTTENLGIVVGKDGVNGTNGQDGAKGDKGEKGDTGADGKDGNTPYINANGNWQIGDTDTGIKAEGKDGVNGTNGQDGAKGDKGEQGIQGEKGDKGDKGDTGVGVSSVSIDENNHLLITLSDNPNQPIDLGNVKGEKGDKGDKGDTGANGTDGQNGQDGIGIDSVKIENGILLIKYTNTADYTTIGNVKGDDGVGIAEVYVTDGYIYVRKTNETTAIQLAYIKGEKGDTGAKGDNGNDGTNGVDGKSAYELYCEAHPEYTGTMDEWLTSLKGEKGDTGKGIEKTELINGELIITYTDGTSDNLGAIISDVNYDEYLKYTILSDTAVSVSLKSDYISDLEGKIIIPSEHNGRKVTAIAKNGFKNCMLTEIVLPNTLTTIYAGAFSKCTNLKSITIPKSVTCIRYNAFFDSGLEKASFENTAGWKKYTGISFENGTSVSSSDLSNESKAAQLLTKKYYYDSSLDTTPYATYDFKK